MSKARGWLFVTVACGALTACGGKDDGGGGGGGEADAGTTNVETVEAFCPAVLDGIANRAGTCFGGPVAAWRALVEGEGANALCSQWSRGVAGGRMTFDASETRTCFDALPAVACADLIGGPQPTACKAALSGQVATGGACFADAECSGDATICDLTSTCPGKCAARVEAGGSCAAPEAVCAFGTSCVSSTCTADASTGESCSEEHPCGFGLVCLAQSSDAKTGRCQPAAASGACSTSSMCLPTFACAGPNGSSQCARAKPEGTACTEGFYECDVLTSCVSGRCQAFPRLGGTCDPTAASGEFSDCLQGTCSGGRCVALKGEGQACQQGSECASGVCTSNACAAACQAP
ncbi:MAG: hypothetical protein QM765_48840 [Myxococcales bacterium]